jgi:uncharacterized delta-60 repeat protein
MGFIRDNTNSFEVYLTDLGKQKFFEDGFKDSISYFSISDTDSNYTIFNPALNEIIPFEKMSEINIGDVVSFDTIVQNNNNSDGTIDNTFNIGTGFTGDLFIIARQPDSKILAGGNLTSYNGVTRNYIIRLNSDGTIDNTFNIGTGFGGTVTTIALQPDNKILVGGAFTSYSGTTRNRIIRLNSDGTIDNTFTIGNGFNGTTFPIVNTIALQPDGKILVGGDFTSYSGITSNYIVRLNTGGTIDNTFTIGTGFTGTTNPIISTIVLQPDGKILVGGGFTTYSGTTRNRIIRLNTGGTIDNTFNIGTGFTNNVQSIVLQPDGKILAGGAFTTYSGTTRNRIIRLNTGGTIDNTFNIGTGFGGSFSFVSTINLQLDGKILVGGNFTTYSGTTRNSIIRLNTDGTIDNTFNIGTGFGVGTVRTIVLQPDYKILVGGNFTSYSGVTRNNIVRLNSDLNIIIRYFRKIKEFNNYDEVPYSVFTSTINTEYWEEVFPFDSTNINPQTIQTLNHNGVKKTSLPLNIPKENDYSINRTITITSLSNYNSMLNGTMLVGDSIGNNGKYSEVIHLIYNEFNPSVIIPPLVTFPPVFNEKIRKSAIIASENTKIYSDYKSGIIGNGSKIANNIYINITEEQIILEEGVFNGIVIKPYYENTWEHDPQTLTPAINHVSYFTGGTTQLVFNFDAYYSQEYYVFTVLDDYNTPPVGNGQIKITTPSGETTTFSIINTNGPTGQTRNFFIASPYPPQLNSISGDTLTVSFDYFIPDLINIQILAVNNFIIGSKLQINVINDIFTQTTLRGDIVDGLNYRNALFGIKNKIQKDYVML